MALARRRKYKTSEATAARCGQSVASSHFCRRKIRFWRSIFAAAWLFRRCSMEGEFDMTRISRAWLFVALFLALAPLGSALPAAAQDPLGGAIVGGAVGGIIGGALGRGGGAIAGAAIGATTGAVIAAEAAPRPGGYYWWRGGCYYRYPNGAWSPLLAPNYCGY
jgi:hypothetical protein